MTDDLLTDACGRALPRTAVIKLARANMRVSSEPDTTSFDSDAALLQWATDADGCFNPTQVAAYGHTFVADQAQNSGGR